MRTERNERSLEALRRIARLFDAQFRVPGTGIRFGIDPLIGLVPGIGDLASPLLTLGILWHAARLRVPKIVLVRMVINALVDAFAGAVPVVGDLFDFGWKATEWNMALLERHAMPGRPATSGDYLFVSLCVGVVAAAALLPILAAWATLEWLRAAFTPH
jgi:Domain of unknown function (DUF4112)